MHAVSQHAGDFVLSPDENWLAFEELWQTYVTPFPHVSTPLEIGPEMKNLPVKKLSTDAGTYLSWSPDSKIVSLESGSRVLQRRFGLSLCEGYIKTSVGRTSANVYKPIAVNLGLAGEGRYPEHRSVLRRREDSADE